MRLKSRHLLGLENMPKEDIELILNTAVSFKEVLERPIKKIPTLQGKTIVNLFLKVQQEHESLLNLQSGDCQPMLLILQQLEVVWQRVKHLKIPLKTLRR